MSTKENKAVVRAFIDEVENRAAYEAIDRYLMPNFIDHGSYGITRENLIHHMKMMRKAFPDTHLRIKRQVAENDIVVNHMEFTGTHEGTFLGVPPTGKKFKFDVLMIFRVADGKLKEHWGMVDQLSILQRLGLVEDYTWP